MFPSPLRPSNPSDVASTAATAKEGLVVVLVVTALLEMWSRAARVYSSPPSQPSRTLTGLLRWRLRRPTARS